MRNRIFVPLWLGLLVGATAVGAATTLNGAEFYSNETVKYGRWEIRMEVAATPGSVSSFFTYYNNSYLGSPEPWREIDIEILGKNGNGFQSNLITGNAATKTTSEVFHTSTSDLSQGFHTYVLDWTPDSVVYRFDGQTVRNNPASNSQVIELTSQPMSYRMNIWASTAADWVGALDMNKLPIVQTVNWISYSAYTPGQGPGGSNFTPRWTDDFNTLDTQRWSRGNWTFDQNMADFTPNNAVVSGGYLMLILSNKSWTGTATPPSDPQGNTRPTSSIPLRPKRSGQRTQSFGERLVWDAGIFPEGLVAVSLDGRMVIRGIDSGAHRYAGFTQGIPLGNGGESIANTVK